MAQSRILDYDGEYVTFWYNRHEDNQHVTEKIHAYTCLSLMLLNLENNLKIGDVVLNYILNTTILNVLVGILFTLTILFKSRIIHLKE